MKGQEEIWNNIAEEWNEFRTKPLKPTLEFLKKSNKKVLDLGSGSGRHLVNIKNGKMYLVDFSEKMLKLAKEKAKKAKIKADFIKSNLTQIPFKDNFFDFAICISALHCVRGEKNREKTIKELYRVLKPNSKAEIAVWDKN